MTVEEGGGDATEAPEGTEAEVDLEETPEDGDDSGTETAEDDGAVEETGPRLALDEYGDHMVTVKVDGKDVEMSLKDALGATMRQADYTRKTQELAQERERLSALANLEQWLQADPAGTLQALAKSLGVTIGSADGDDEDDDEDLDPVQAEIRELRAFKEQLEQERTTAAEQRRLETIVTEAKEVLSAVGLTDLDVPDGMEGPEEVLLRYAVDNQIGSLKTAARLLKADQAETKQAAQQSKVKQAKRSAAVVAGGRSKAPGSTVPAKAKRMTVYEAFEAAKAAAR